jgi:hypothetical protein
VAGAGTPLIDLGDAAVLEGVIDGLSEDAVRIQPGNPVTQVILYPSALIEDGVRVR